MYLYPVLFLLFYSAPFTTIPISHYPLISLFPSTTSPLVTLILSCRIFKSPYTTLKFGTSTPSFSASFNGSPTIFSNSMKFPFYSSAMSAFSSYRKRRYLFNILLHTWLKPRIRWIGIDHIVHHFFWQGMSSCLGNSTNF